MKLKLLQYRDRRYSPQSPLFCTHRVYQGSKKLACLHDTVLPELSYLTETHEDTRLGKGVVLKSPIHTLSHTTIFSDREQIMLDDVWFEKHTTSSSSGLIQATRFRGELNSGGRLNIKGCVFEGDMVLMNSTVYGVHLRAGAILQKADIRSSNDVVQMSGLLENNRDEVITLYKSSDGLRVSDTLYDHDLMLYIKRKAERLSKEGLDRLTRGLDFMREMLGE